MPHEALRLYRSQRRNIVLDLLLVVILVHPFANEGAGGKVRQRWQPAHQDVGFNPFLHCRQDSRPGRTVTVANIRNALGVHLRTRLQKVDSAAYIGHQLDIAGSLFFGHRKVIPLAIRPIEDAFNEQRFGSRSG